MRYWVVPIVCGLAACSSSGSKSVNPGMARFVGTWEGQANGQTATLVVEGDQKATFTLGSGSGEPRIIKGTCFPGSDTLSFTRSRLGRDKVDAGQNSYLFSTRPDGTLVVAAEGASVVLRRR